MNLKHTTEFDLAYRFITETNLNIFLTGKAGTGKTTFLRHLRDTTMKRMAIAAPTGVAAINAGGVTLHSMFQLPFGPFIPVNSQSDKGIGVRSLISRLRYNREKINFILNLELLVIDEVSMVSCFILDEIDAILRHVRKNPNQPFGGVQVLLIGDLYQLQPVVRKDEWQILNNYYSSIFFFDSVVFRNNPLLMIELKEIFRQKDEAFIDILNQIRNNNLQEDKIDVLNARLQRNFNPADDDGYITLTTHNDQARIINDNKLSLLPGKTEMFEADIDGEFPEQMFPADKNLILKTGAQVMFIKNDNDEKKYFNGKIGVVSGFEEDRILVRCDEEIISVGQKEWDNIRYTSDPATHQVKEETLGTFSQFPLRLAWAITIHKSQGLTFKKLVVDAENAFANGQVYVALSRAASLEGLVLTSPLNRRFLGAHNDLRTWQEKNAGDNDLEKKFTESRNAYCRNELAAVFSWKEWTYQMNALKKLTVELKNNLPPETAAFTDEIISEQKELITVADNFKAKIYEYCNSDPALEQNSILQERVAKASLYFQPLIADWLKKLEQHTYKLTTKKESAGLDELLNDIYSLVSEIKFKIELCGSGFMLNDFLGRRRNMNLNADALKSAYVKKDKPRDAERSADDLTEDQLYDALLDFRRKESESACVELYRVFTNKTLRMLCEELPGDENSLLNIQGFGKKKVASYGKEIVNIISEYCADTGRKPLVIPAREKKASLKNQEGKLSPTIESTIELFKSGKTIAEICKERGLAESTIEGHLSQAISNKKINIEDVLQEEEINKIKSLLPEDFKLADLYSHWKTFPEGISFSKTKMVVSGLQK